MTEQVIQEYACMVPVRMTEDVTLCTTYWRLHAAQAGFVPVDRNPTITVLHEQQTDGEHLFPDEPVRKIGMLRGRVRTND